MCIECLFNFLNSKKCFFILSLLNFIVVSFVFLLFINTVSGDEATYIGLAKGILHGRYSYWYFLPEYIPDTFRTPGYPLFLLLFIVISDSVLVIKIVQFLLYILSIYLLLRLLWNEYKTYIYLNIFLVILLPNIQLTHYAAYIFPEIPMIFCIVLYVYIELQYKNNIITKSILIGIIWGIAFQMRPIFLLFPIFKLLVDAIWLRKKILSDVMALVVYILILIPYVWWNYSTHKVFSITPLEGSGGVMHLGFWQHRLPDVLDKRYWTTYTGDEPIKFIRADEREYYLKQYHREWDTIDSLCRPYLTAQDSMYLPVMMRYPALFKTYSASYTRKREELLRRYTLAHIAAEPWYVVQIKTYTLFRQFITGVNVRQWQEAGVGGRLKLLIPPLVTGFLFVLGGIFIPLGVWRRYFSRAWASVLLGLCVYYWGIHVLMSIQSRYTIPIHLCWILLISISLAKLFEQNLNRVSHEL